MKRSPVALVASPGSDHRAVAVFETRTALEDRVLREELEGYAGYARRTPHRLLPAVW